MTSVTSFKRIKEAPRSMRSEMDTRIFNAEQVQNFILPPFQRPLRVNDKVRAMAEELKINGGVISGVLTMGYVGNNRSKIWLVDGQHRIEAFKISGLDEIIADVRLCHFDSVSDMADEFVRLNSQLVRMRPDDILRGLEGSTPSLQAIRKYCPFVGYDQIRRGGALGSRNNNALLSMSAAIRAWTGSKRETPSASMTPAVHLGAEMTVHEAEAMCAFLNLAYAAWGDDPAYYRLWGALNLIMCMHTYHLLVIAEKRNPRLIKLNATQFKSCLMALSADAQYIDWLSGRPVAELHRGPCFSRIRKIFLARMKDDGAEMKLFPQPSWARASS